MKIYTKTGDTGMTSLFGGDRVDKFHPRIEAYGTVDETNALLGLVRSHLTDPIVTPRIDPILARIQSELFILGADLATPPESKASVPRIASSHCLQLENDIDTFEHELPPLKHFILPTGHHCACTLHVARTVCRRAERLAVQASHQEAIQQDIIIYLNRLSDLLFVLARWCNITMEVREEKWTMDN